MLGIFTPYARINGRTLAYVAVAELALLLALWTFSSVSFLPSPMEVVDRLGVHLNRGLLFELWVSLRLNLEALAIATALALALSYTYVLPFMRPIANLVARMRYFGTIGIAFVFYVLIADSHWIKVATIVFGILPYLTAATVEMVRSVEDEQFHHARTLRLGHWGTTWQVLVRGRLDLAIEALRQNASIGWMMVAMVEGTLRTEGGIGVMLVEQSKYLKLADLFAILLAIFVFGALQDLLFRFIRNRVAPYATLDARSL